MKIGPFLLLTIGILVVRLTFLPPSALAQSMPYKVLSGHTDGVNSVAFSPDGKIIASGSSDTTIRLWGADAGNLIHTLEGHTGSVNSVAFSPNGSIVASGSGFSYEIGLSDDSIRLWDTSTGAHLRTLEGHIGGINSIAFSPDGKIIVAGGGKLVIDDLSYRLIDLWNADTGAHLRTINSASGSELFEIHSVAFSPDGGVIAGGGWGSPPARAPGHIAGYGHIQVWDANTGNVAWYESSHTHVFSAITFSPVGDLVGGSVDGTIRLGRYTDTNDPLDDHSLEGHIGPISSVVFSPDGKTLASGSWDKTIRLWNANTGRHIRTLEGHIDWVNSVVFSPDGKTLASGSWDKTIRLWGLTPARVRVTPSAVIPPSTGARLSVDLAIVGGENIAGYQVSVTFDPTTLRYVEGVRGAYLPTDAFFGQPKVEEGSVTLASTSGRRERDGGGILATLTFEVVAVKPSMLTLSHVTLSNGSGDVSYPGVEHGKVLGIAADVNGDGTVTIADLVAVVNQLGQKGKSSADVDSSGVVTIADLVLVAGALDDAAAAPSVCSQDQVKILAKTNVQAWLREARRLNLTDAASQRGILFLENLLAALMPKETLLLPNYPNPFNPETWIPYQLTKPTDVTLTIYAMDGAVVRTLALGHQAAGKYHNKARAAYWDGRNAIGELVASGVYFYTLSAGDFTATRKMFIRK